MSLRVAQLLSTLFSKFLFCDRQVTLDIMSISIIMSLVSDYPSISAEQTNTSLISLYPL